jgi:hypothetical protein
MFLAFKGDLKVKAGDDFRKILIWHYNPDRTGSKRDNIINTLKISCLYCFKNDS